MAKNLFRISILNKKNHNPLSIVAYYCGQTQFDLFKKNKFNPDPKKKVLYNNLIVSDKFLLDIPDYLKVNGKKKDIVDNARTALWKSIDNFEKRFDSQFARLFELSIPYFFSIEEAKNLLNEFSIKLSDYGMICDISIHKTNTEQINILGQDSNNDKNLKDQDYSCYIMSTLRAFNEGGFTNKNRNWNSKDQLISWRQSWFLLLKEHVNKNLTNKDEKDAWLKKISYKLEEKIIDTIDNNVEYYNVSKKNSYNSPKVFN